MRILKTILFSVVLFSIPSAYAQLKNDEPVTEFIFRGSVPSEDKDFITLKERYKISTILDLRAADSILGEVLPILTGNEGKDATRFGLQYLNIPVLAFVKPKTEDVVQILNTLKKANENNHIYIHCHFGDDRTGFLIALYRIHVQGWSAEAAETEMLKLFHGNLPPVHPLYKFFKDHSGPGSLPGIQE